MYFARACSKRTLIMLFISIEFVDSAHLGSAIYKLSEYSIFHLPFSSHLKVLLLFFSLQVVSSGHAHHDVLPPYYFPGASSPSPHSNDSWGDMFDSEESFYVMNIDPLMTTDTETGVQEISLQMGTVQSFPLNTDPPPTNTPVNLQDFIQNTPPPSENSPMNTTTIQLMQGTSHTVNGLSIQVMQPTTLVQTTTIQFVQSGEITSSLELVAQPSLVPPNVNYNFLPEPNFEYLQETGINESPLHPLSPINPEQIVTTPNQLIHPASDQLAADAQLQSPNQQLNTTTIQLLDPNSQQVNASVEWMQLGNQVMSNDAYEAMLLLPPLAMSNLQAESEEEIFALVPY
ncbi:hypothetical protein NPIL_577511 [Nephila pilipes]|uniref:Uncharacterized protein n=1 Tax=Nephila pilipes TaxID=299642 RepID=A0A8X6R500_NEPPI|nr:hypothetical protein NPIL_577511 [Nephila pilipes]